MPVADSGGCGVVLVGDNGVDAVMRRSVSMSATLVPHSRFGCCGVSQLY